MKDWILIPTVSVGLAVLASALTGAFTSERFDARANPRMEGSLSDAQLAAKLDQLSRSLEDIEARNAALEQELADLRSNPVASARTEVGGLDAAVARWMERNARTLAQSGLEDEARSAAGDGTVDAYLRQLLADDLTGQERQDLWQEIRDNGHLDEVIGQLELLAEANPHDPDAHCDLGSGYLQKIYEVGPGPMASVWGQKADEAFDEALTLDDTHWEARISKAVSLSNWPAFLGKSGEAIQNFETLIAQQEGREPESRFAQTYYFLGNMYQQTGESEKALEAWKRGLEMFPENDLLRGQLALTNE